MLLVGLRGQLLWSALSLSLSLCLSVLGIQLQGCHFTTLWINDRKIGNIDYFSRPSATQTQDTIYLVD